MRPLLLTLFTSIALLIGFAGHAYAEPTPAEIEKQIDDRWEKLEPLIEQHNGSKIKLTSQQAQVAELNRQLAPFEDRVAFTRARVGYYADYIYRGGHALEVNSMLASENATAFSRRMKALDMLAAHQNETISDALTAIKTLKDARKPLDDLVAQSTLLEADLAKQVSTIEAEIKDLDALRLKAYGNLAGTGALAPVPCPYEFPGGKAGTVVKFACAQIGKMYKFATSGPNTFDCSGLTLRAWAQVGVSLPHFAAAQKSISKPVTRAELRPGDLVFYYSDVHHVGMYVGGGWIVHASQTGKPIQMRLIDKAPISGYGRPGG